MFCSSKKIKLEIEFLLEQQVMGFSMIIFAKVLLEEQDLEKYKHPRTNGTFSTVNNTYLC